MGDCVDKRERDMLRLLEDFRDTLENEIAEQQTENKRIEIKDIKFVGQATWKDKINGNDISDNVFIVEKEIKEIDENGKERITEQKSYYLGDKCIGGTIDDNEVVYNSAFENLEPDKLAAVNKLLENVNQKDLEENSLNKLRRKELAKVLSAHLGREISEDEVEKLLEEMNKDEIEELQDEEEELEDKDENDLSEKQADKIKVNGIQKVDLNKLVDGNETLGKRLDLQQYDSLYVVYSEKVDEITAGTKRNNTTYALVGMTNDGEAKALNDEFEIDKTAGNNADKETTKIKADSTATKDNRDLSMYTRKSNGMSIGFENNKGNVDIFLYQRTLENENVGIQVETERTRVIPLETREIMNRSKGVYQTKDVKKEIDEHIREGCEPDDVKDFDGKEETSTHEHLGEKTLDEYVMDIYNYENEYGEELIKEVFTEDEVKDKLLREIEENKDKLSIEQIVENVQEEMNEDAEIFVREHKL